MQIPSEITSKISSNYSLDSLVKGCVGKVSGYLDANNMVFFPEYTDHQLKHFEDVLTTAVDLATEYSIGLLTQNDLAILTMAVMLHDLGMHLSKDGFKTLIAHDSKWQPIPEFRDKKWHILWQEFLSEARRFDERKLEQLFGPHFRPVTDFPDFESDWTDADYMLVGEFLRRHHPRLAHEIALYGMPAIDGASVPIITPEGDLQHALADLSGLVARSHGMSVRDTFGYMKSRYSNKIEARSSHPIFLMVLLRIADYLQIQSTRAPAAHTDVVRFRSPVSAREWAVHQCVTDLTSTTDPEAIDIIARPHDVDTYIRLKEWIVDLQRELDVSWAVLGEVYGLQSHNRLNKLSLRIRRIRSNIDDISTFSGEITFVPEKIAFHTADSDLLKLLVGPLYGGEISVGLRELVQNSTDAVKELDSIKESNPDMIHGSSLDLPSDVCVEFVEGDSGRISSVVISDRGVGMNLEVIRDYFLRAGASFRGSDVWKELHEDEDGRSKVQRTGRFGVGALSAFLLGNEIVVQTRHYSAKNSEGYKFTARIESRAINIEKCVCPYGTRIEVKVSERNAEYIRELIPFYRVNEGGITFHDGVAGYFNKYPECKYFLGDSEVPWNEDAFLPSPDNKRGWNYFDDEFFQVYWGYLGNVPSLTVNGFSVLKGGRYKPHSDIDFGHIFDCPKLSVVDQYGYFPLNLQRNQVASKKLPFEDDLFREVIDEFIITLLQCSILGEDNLSDAYSGFRYQRGMYLEYEPNWWFCKEGKLLNIDCFLGAYEPRYLLVYYSDMYGHEEVSDLKEILNDKTVFFFDKKYDFSGMKPKIKTSIYNLFFGGASSFSHINVVDGGVFMPKTFVDIIHDRMRPGKDVRAVLSSLEEDVVAGWLRSKAAVKVESEGLQRWRNAFNITDRPKVAIGHYVLKPDLVLKENDLETQLFDRWIELLKVPYLPFDVEHLKEIRSHLVERMGRKAEDRLHAVEEMIKARKKRGKQIVVW